MSRLWKVLGLSTFLALTACAHQPEQGPSEEELDARRGEEVPRVCFSRFLSGFQVLGRDRLIVSKGRRQYELQMFSLCPELKFAHHLGFDSFGSCLSSGDRVLAYPYGVHPGDWRPPSCRIDKIYQWLPAPDPDAAEAENS